MDRPLCQQSSPVPEPHSSPVNLMTALLQEPGGQRTSLGLDPPSRAELCPLGLAGVQEPSKQLGESPWG